MESYEEFEKHMREECKDWKNSFHPDAIFRLLQEIDRQREYIETLEHNVFKSIWRKLDIQLTKDKSKKELEQKKAEKEKKILHNRAKCLKCGDIIESKYRHDFVQCSCGEIFVDGGLDYQRWGANDFKNIFDMSEYEEEQ